MSLFKAREWWSPGRREETSSSLSVGVLTGGEQGSQQVYIWDINCIWYSEHFTVIFTLYRTLCTVQ